MPQRLEVYKCLKCGNIVEIMHGGGAPVVCCGEPMKLMAENSQDAAQEKHVPVIKKTASGYAVKVGSVAHPMEEKHYIEWIEIVADGAVHRQYLKPGDSPEAHFALEADHVYAREFCNVHGHWKGQVN